MSSTQGVDGGWRGDEGAVTGGVDRLQGSGALSAGGYGWQRCLNWDGQEDLLAVCEAGGTAYSGVGEADADGGGRGGWAIKVPGVHGEAVPYVVSS